MEDIMCNQDYNKDYVCFVRMATCYMDESSYNDRHMGGNTDVIIPYG